MTKKSNLGFCSKTTKNKKKAKREVLDTGARLRTLRMLMGLTQKELEGIAGVTQSMISGIERGDKTASEEILIAVANATGTPYSFFHIDPDDLPTDTLHFRKKASAPAKEVDRVKATAREAYRVAAQLITETHMRRLPLPRAEGEIDDASIETLAAETRDALGVARDGILKHVIRTCERAGIPVVPLVLVDGSGEQENVAIGHSGVSCWRGVSDPQLIAYFGTDAGDRQRFTVAHELGHLVLHPARRAISAKQAEAEAHRFAGAFLIPEEQAREALGGNFTLRNLAVLKANWGISMQALIERAFGLGLIDSTRRSSLYRQMATNQWRSREPVTVHPEQPALMRMMMTRRFGASPSPRSAAEELGLHPVLMRSLAPENSMRPGSPSGEVVSLRGRRRGLQRA
ncbi:XRE family transcriptional regulator [Streptomyces cyaneofuscatus]|uniref:helix-turn-helix domain-containing protein n=1 Tax=Streptomyces cyaneofuscatus TaxID=66883 RepID=UPI00343B75AD